MDNIDLGGLVVPLTFDGAKVTPWAMVGFFGPHALKDNSNLGNAYKSVQAGIFPAVPAYKWDKKNAYAANMPLASGLA